MHAIAKSVVGLKMSKIILYNVDFRGKLSKYEQIECNNTTNVVFAIKQVRRSNSTSTPSPVGTSRLTARDSCTASAENRRISPYTRKEPELVCTSNFFFFLLLLLITWKHCGLMWLYHTRSSGRIWADGTLITENDFFFFLEGSNIF